MPGKTMDPPDTTSFEPDWVSPPGDTIQDLLDERNMGVSELEDELSLSARDVDRLLSGDLELDEKIADRIEGVFGARASFWLAGERNYRTSLLEREKP